MTDKGNINSKYPLAIPAASFAAGIVSCRYFFVFPEYSLPSVLLIIIPLLFYKSLTANPHIRNLLVITIFFMVGNFNLNHIQSSSSTEPFAEHPVSASFEAVVSGKIRNAPSYNGRTGRFILAAEQIKINGGQERRIAAKILFRTTFRLPETIEPGTQVLIRASFSKPSPPGTPGTFNYRQYLLDQGIRLTGFIRSSAHMKAFYNTPEPDNLMNSPFIFSQLLRHRANKIINRANISDRLKGLYKAIITGERYEMPVDVLDNFKKSGAIHLLAISGMHMALLALLCGMILNFILKRSEKLMLLLPIRKISALLALFIMALYATISGMQPPVIRSFIMAAALIIAFVMDRPGSLLNVLALAALLILTFDPVSLFSASFQMSFAAVAAIIIFAEANYPKTNVQDDSLRTKLSRPITDAIKISIIALLATAPITIYHFHQISILSPISTLLAAPLICFWALPLGLAGLVFSNILPELGASLFSLGSLGLFGADFITSRLAEFPFAAYTIPPPTLIRITSYYLVAGMLIFRPATNLRKIIITIVLILLMAIPPSGFYLRNNDQKTRVTFIDIGQGSSTLLELFDGTNILIDGGGSTSIRFDPGEQIISPFLWERNIKKLDAVIITHAHQDHYNGLEFIIRNFKPETVWTNSDDTKSAAFQNIIKTAESSGARIIVPDKNEVIFSSEATKLTCLGGLHLRKIPGLQENSRSLVTKLETAGMDIIFPGDIAAEDGLQLIEQQCDLECNILLAPHHGSRFSAGYQLVQQAKPQWVVVSASAIKKDFFPDRKFADWLEENGVIMINTGDYGSITFTASADNKIDWQPISQKGLQRQRMN